MRIAVIGSSLVGTTLAAGFERHGHEVRVGSRSSSKLAEWLALNPRITAGSVEQTAAYGEIIVLAVKGTAAVAALELASSANLSGKIIIDATNPIADAPPVDGVLQYFTSPNDSLMERLQRQWPDARFVKAFNSVGAASMVNPSFSAGPPSMFICGNDAAAKASVAQIVQQFGWEVADMGSATAARAIEPLCMLWCIPGFVKNEWSHAFKLLHA